MKTILALLVLLTFPALSFSGEIKQIGTNAFGGNLVDEIGLTSDKTYTYDLGTQSIEKISTVVTYASATIAEVSFTDGQTSTGTITVISTTSLCGKYVTFNGSVFNFFGCAPYNSATDTLITSSASVTATAANLCNAITVTNLVTAAISTCTTTAGVVDIVSKYSDGVAYSLATSSAPLVSIGGSATGAGIAPTYSASANTITKANRFTVALPLLYVKGTNALPGLTTGTTYFAIPVTEPTVFKLATSKVNALAGTAVDFTVQLASAAASTYTLTPLPITGSPAFIWQFANDESNYITYASSGGIANLNVTETSKAYDFGDFNYRFLRMNVTAPTAGAVLLRANLYLKRK